MKTTPQSKSINAELYKEVSKVELSSLIPGIKFPSRHDHAIVDKDGNILSFCSDNYNLRTNSSLFEPLENQMKSEKIPFDRKVVIRDGTRFYVDYIIGDRVKGPSVNDILPKFSVWNSYDGTLRTVLKFGFYRVVCSNGLTVPHGKTVDVYKKHYKASKVADGIDISAMDSARIVEPFREFLNSTKEYLGIYENLNNVEADVKKILDICEKLKFSKAITDTAVNRFNLETATNGTLTYVNENGELVTHDGSPATLYTAYNAINYAIYNNNPKEYPEVKLKRDELVLAEVLA
jgi:hypothetical protein